ncbi:DUF7848 domain-containing protein [Streptomyces sp. SD11]|uniref:DUF7848 domain-containing protein n=1 Tax=Streptomyces sp. SD11 TaxID=3452209 RepID=UPI003F887083
MSKTYRFRNYEVVADETAMPSVQAVCVVGEDADCGADSSEQPDETALSRWMTEHTAATGHDRFRRAQWDYVMVKARSWQ